MRERIGKVLKNKRLILTILISILFIVSVSYAMYNIVLQGQRNHSITTSKLTFSYKEPLDALNLLTYGALTDEEGKAQDNYYEFTIKSTSDAAEVIDYVIYLQKEESENSFSSSDIKVYLTSVSNNVETEVLKPTLISSLGKFNRIDNTGALYGSTFTFTDIDLENKEETYRLRIWLKEGFDFDNYVSNTTTNGEQNIKLDSYEYKFKVNVATGEMPDTVAPTLTIIDSISDDSKNPTITSNSSYTISGTATDESGIKSVKVNGTAVTVNSDGSFSKNITLTANTVTTVTVVATDNYDRSTTVTRYVIYNSAAPTLTVSTPTGTSSSNPTATNSANYTVSGTVSDSNGIKSLTINNQSVTVNSNGSFSKSITLTANTVTTVKVVATDNYDRSTTVNRYVIYNSNNGPTISLTKTGGKNTATINATISDSSNVAGYAITNNTTTPTSWTTVNNLSSVTAKFTKTSAGTYFVHAIDSLGATSYQEVSLSYSTNSNCSCSKAKECCYEDCGWVLDGVGESEYVCETECKRNEDECGYETHSACWLS